MSVITSLVLGVFAILFGAVGLSLFIQFQFVAGFIALFIGILPIALVYLERLRHENSKEFEDWIKASIRRIEAGTAFYKGQRVSLESKVVRYHGCISIVIATFKFSSQWMLVSEGEKYKYIFTLLTLFFGWWGFPWGPVYSFQALSKNLNGGEVVSLAQLVK